MMAEQLPLPDMPEPEPKAEEPQPATTAVEPPPGLTPRASLRAAMGAFEKHMQYQGFAENTITAFLSDLNILTQFVGVDTAIGDISTNDLNHFTDWLVNDRGVPCSPKSLARRVTTLKVFFEWLNEVNVLPKNPADPVVHKPVVTPLPDVLSEPQIERALDVTERMRYSEKPDARPHLLLTLLLHTGIKKSECMRIVLNHLDLSDPEQPILWIRYANPRRRHKERKLALPLWWPAVLSEYRAQYQPQEELFDCTARNLEYVLADVAERADIRSGISFEKLRWTCATRDYKSGMAGDKLRQKMGISKITWREMRVKLAKLAKPPL
jgi:integrase/recombinase XerD